MKTAIVTGAYGSIGKAISRHIAKSGYRLFLIGRDEAKLNKLCNELKTHTHNKDIFHQCVDLSLKSEIETFARSWNGQLQLLINNAAASPPIRTETTEGIEFQFATNVLGYYWMIKSFYRFMIDQEDARIVNVASYWAGGMDLSDLEFKRRPYDNNSSYRQSKQADRMLTLAFSTRLQNNGISVNSCHPGDVNSKLSNDLGFGGHETPDEGASTPVWLSVSPDVKNITGKYFENKKMVRCSFCDKVDEVEKLFEICSHY